MWNPPYSNCKQVCCQSVSVMIASIFFPTTWRSRLLCHALDPSCVVSEWQLGRQCHFISTHLVGKVRPSQSFAASDNLSLYHEVALIHKCDSGNWCFVSGINLPGLLPHLSCRPTSNMAIGPPIASWPSGMNGKSLVPNWYS